MIENSIVYRNFKGKYSFFRLSRAQGSEVWDEEGKRHIDFSSGWNVVNLGWNHPEIAEAIMRQTQKNVHGLLWGSEPAQEEYAAALTKALPKELDACVKETGGTESVEVAIKIARVYTGRKKIIGFDESYHGQLFASLAAGAQEKLRHSLAPLVPSITPAPFPSSDMTPEEYESYCIQFEHLLENKDVAALLMEPSITTGWGSTRLAYPGFLKKVRELTARYGTLLIVDEVGTGFSRTGTLFGIEHEGVTPDLMAFAKGISNGAAAIGTVVGKTPIFEKAFEESVLISTFGWTPLGCAAALEVLKINQRDKVWELAAQSGAYIQDRLRSFIGGKVTGVRGLGMEIGVQFVDAATCSKVRGKANQNGLLVVVGSENNMQIMPPLTISRDLIDEGLNILMRSIEQV